MLFEGNSEFLRLLSGKLTPGDAYGPAGVVYAAIGVGFAAPTTHVQFWRLAAWVVAAVVFAVQIGYEHVALRGRPIALAWHTAVGAAVGALGLAIFGPLRSHWGTPTVRLALIVLVAWPVITGLPAFLVAFVTGSVLRRLFPR